MKKLKNNIKLKKNKNYLNQPVLTCQTRDSDYKIKIT
jgi:hypothetical protein